MKQGNTLVNFVMMLLALGLAAYLGFYAWNSFTDPFATTYTYSYTANDSVEADGYLVREELVLPAQSGILELTRAEGERVGKGHTVALVHRDNQALEIQAQLSQLATEIGLLDYAMNQTDDAVSAARLDESILQSLAQLRYTATSGGYGQLSAQVVELKSQVLKRGYTFGDGLDAEQLSSQRQELVSQYRALRSQASQATSYVTAPEAGVFSSLTDGYEAVLTPQSILTLSPSSLDGVTGGPVSASSTPGKLITSNWWYFVTALEEESAARLAPEMMVTMRFSGAFNRDVSMRVVQVGPVEEGRAVVVLSSSRYLSQTTLLRSQTAELIFSSHSGLRIPKEALRMITQERTNDEMGEVTQTSQVGVYAIVGGRTEFKSVEILAEGADYYVVASAVDGKTALRAGDEIIVRATDLYAGKLLEN